MKEVVVFLIYLKALFVLDGAKVEQFLLQLLNSQLHILIMLKHHF